MKRRMMLAAALFLLVVPLAASAQPAFVTIQGVLTDANDVPIDEETDLTISIYASDTDTTPLYTETQSVLVDGGFFTLYLGAVQALDLELFKNNSAPFLGITVGDEAEMAPRLPIGTVPFAAFAPYAGDAATLGGMAPSDFRASADAVSWNDLGDVPSELTDGDADTLAGMSCTDGQVIKFDATTGVWVCAVDIDTTLTETDVDAMVDNNGYAMAGDLADVATTGDFADLINVPADIADGDADTLATLSCAEGELAKWDDTAQEWICGVDVDTDTLIDLALTCVGGQLPKWNDGISAWECAEDIDTGFSTEAELTSLLDDNYIQFGQPDVITSLMILDGTVGPVDLLEQYALLNHSHDADYLPIDYTPDWSQLTGIPADIADGDGDTLAEMGPACMNGQIAKWDSGSSTWLCGDDIDTGFTTESELTGLLDDNYAALAHDHDAAYVNVGEPNSITSGMIVDGTVTAADLLDAYALAGHNHDAAYVNVGEPDSINSSMIVDGTVAAVDLAESYSLSTHNHDADYVNTGEANSITSAMIVDGSVGQADIATDGVGAAEIAANAVGTSEVADNSLTASDLANNSVQAAELSDTIYTVSSTLNYSVNNRSGWTNVITAGDDVCSAAFNIGFNFPFFGTNYTQARVSSNGVIFLGGSCYAGYSNSALPTGYTSFPAIFAFWDDMYATSGTTTVSYRTFGASPNRVLFIFYDNLRPLSGLVYMDIMVALHESGLITITYQNINDNSLTRGSSATIGIQGPGGSSAPYRAVSYNVEILDNDANRNSLSFIPPN